MKCPDCKGGGEYIGARVVEACQRCEGTGRLNDDGTPLDPKRRALDAVFKANKLPDWMYDGSNIQLAPELKVGDMLYIYDAGWFEVEVTNIYTHQGVGLMCGQRMVRADYACGHFRILRANLTYNLTQGRWEYIKAGTPVWP